MKKYIKAYMEFLKALSQSDEEFATQKDLEEILIQVKFFQHERLIHLLVTMLFAIVMIACFIVVVIFESIVFLPIALLCLIMLIFYVIHYYLLENSVQKMYMYYNLISAKAEK